MIWPFTPYFSSMTNVLTAGVSDDETSVGFPGNPVEEDASSQPVAFKDLPEAEMITVFEKFLRAPVTNPSDTLKAFKEIRQVPQLDMSQFAGVDPEVLFRVARTAYANVQLYVDGAGRNSHEMSKLLHRLGNQVNAFVKARRTQLQAAIPEVIGTEEDPS